MSWTPWQSVQTAANPVPARPSGPAPVDAAEILAIRRRRVDVVLHDDRHVFVASGTGQRDVAAIDRGLGVGDGLDDVDPMAVPATGDFPLPPLEVGPAVDAVGIGGRARGPRRGSGLVTRRPAGRGRQVLLGLMGRGPLPPDEPGVAGGAIERRMDRGLKGDMAVAFEAGRHSGRPFVLGQGQGNRGEARRSVEEDDSEPSSNQDSTVRSGESAGEPI